MAKTHNLKIVPTHFHEVVEGNKKFEIRWNDRGFETGDNLCLEEWSPEAMEYTGKECNVNITHMLSGGVYGLDRGYVIMSIILI